MTVTEEWLRTNMNGGIGVTAKQVKALGISYPPKKGWLRNLIGKEITDEQARAFEEGKGITTARAEGTDGIKCDYLSVALYLRTLPVDKYLQSPFLAYGYLKSIQGKCAVCSVKLHSILKVQGKCGVHYVNVCNSCFEKIKKS